MHGEKGKYTSACSEQVKQVGMEDAGYGGGGQVKVGERGQRQQCYRSPNLEKKINGRQENKRVSNLQVKVNFSLMGGCD